MRSSGLTMSSEVWDVVGVEGEADTEAEPEADTEAEPGTDADANVAPRAGVVAVLLMSVGSGALAALGVACLACFVPEA